MGWVSVPLLSVYVCVSVCVGGVNRAPFFRALSVFYSSIGIAYMQAPKIPNNIFWQAKKKKSCLNLAELYPDSAQIFTLAIFFFFFFLGGGGGTVPRALFLFVRQKFSVFYLSSIPVSA